MRSDHYTLTDDDGGHITVSPWPRGDQADGDGATLSWNHDRGGVFIAPERFAEFTAALYEAAGRPGPIILDTPDPKYDSRAVSGFGEFAIDGQRVRLTTACDRCPAETTRHVEAISARAIGAVLASLGDKAAREPDPTQVKRLASFLDESMDTTPEALAHRLLQEFTIEERAA